MGIFGSKVEERRAETPEGLAFLTHPKAHDKTIRAREGVTTLYEMYPPDAWGGLGEARKWRGRRARFLREQEWSVEVGSRYGTPYLIATAPEDVTYVVLDSHRNGG